MSKTASSVSDASSTIEQARDAVKKSANDVITKLHNGVDELSEAGPALLSRIAAQLEDLSRRTLDRTRRAGTQAREQALRAGDATVGYIKDEPVKAVLIAATAGAVAAGLFTWMTRSRDSRS